MRPHSFYRKDFATYAETCFEKFGDRVKNWITFNEPHTFAIQGYDVGLEAPGRCSILLHLFCRAGNSATEPYIVGHNILLSHAAVADIYRKNYKLKQKGSVGVAFDVFWYEPATNTTEDIDATQRAIDFHLDWFLEPLVFGDYPSSMRSRVQTRLPRFSKVQSSLLKGSLDFVGINHYTTWYAKDNSSNSIGVLLNDSLADSGAIILRMSITIPLIQKLFLLQIHLLSLTFSCIDHLLNFQHSTMENLLVTGEDGCNVKGYFAWSLLDNWEWGAGFSSRFGLYYVDYNDNLKRCAKDSVKWFKNLLTST
ncbi:hypothetical protein LguiA_032583 [Lonicera macranthoides]